jgi:16S rRNA processing protein RimM
LLKSGEDRWLLIGTVGKPHGLRGAFFISGRSEPFPASCRQVVLGPDPEHGRVFSVARGSLQPDRPVLGLVEVSDRTFVEGMRGEKIWIARSSLQVDESAEYLWSDIAGAEVFDSTGNLMGRIVDMVNYGASDIAVLENANGQRLDLPFVPVYVDMNFRSSDRRINLLVEAAVFEEFWIKG